jgi:hypothetical protein
MYSFWVHLLLTGMTGISLHMHWLLISQLNNDSFLKENWFLLRIELRANFAILLKLWAIKCQAFQSFLYKDKQWEKVLELYDNFLVEEDDHQLTNFFLSFGFLYRYITLSAFFFIYVHEKPPEF